ncbi:MAG: hypothetical protein C4K48_06475 [Candidatus Thorarchaeota archaeon]|nr:MAG: hypothetical protein C4K48_06475 [Candidatus Thorarchaeota archaeon]
MTENREPLRVYVAVDPAKILRCMWCGLAESETWKRTKYGTYCSTECFYAAEASGFLCVFILEVVLTSVMIGVATPFPLFIGLPFAMLIFSPCLVWARVGWSRQKSVPRNSRRNETSSDIALLKAISSGVLCPRCNANIDVRTIGEDRIYRCEYCGASGTIEVVKTH